MPTKKKTTANSRARVSDMKPRNNVKGGGKKHNNSNSTHHLSLGGGSIPQVPNKPYGPGYNVP